MSISPDGLQGDLVLSHLNGDNDHVVDLGSGPPADVLTLPSAPARSLDAYKINNSDPISDRAGTETDRRPPCQQA